MLLVFLSASRPTWNIFLVDYSEKVDLRRHLLLSATHVDDNDEVNKAHKSVFKLNIGREADWKINNSNSPAGGRASRGKSAGNIRCRYTIFTVMQNKKMFDLEMKI